MSKFRMKKTQGLLDGLEGHLVKEFRSCQAVNALAIEERLALSLNRVQDLPLLGERKIALLEELTQLERARRSAIQEAGEALGVKQPSCEVDDLLGYLDPEPARRLSRLYDGILALTEYTRDLTQGNQVLAKTVLEQPSQV